MGGQVDASFATLGSVLPQVQSGKLTALAVAVLITYLIMVGTFGSLVHPFAILFSLPFGASGALAALAITGRALSIS